MKRHRMTIIAVALTLVATAACRAQVGPDSAGAARPAGPLTAADVRTDGMMITMVATGEELTIEPLRVTHRTAGGTLKVLTPYWRAGAGLPGTGWTFRTLKRGSLVVKRADKPEVTLTENVDYVVDYDWARLGAVGTSSTPAGTQLQYEYEYSASRLDLIQQGPDGRYTVIKGKPDRSQPMLPAAAEGHRAVIGVYLPPNTTELGAGNLNFIDPAATGIPPVIGGAFLTPVLAKLAAAEPVTVVCFGDSITAQTARDFRDGKGSFVDRFATYFKTKYPDREVVETTPKRYTPPIGSQITVVKAGRGGDDTPRGLRRLDRDVLAHSPNLVVIMFGANDENRRGKTKANMVPPAKYQANLTTMVGKIRAGGGTVILMTPAMKNLGWSSTVGNLAQYAAAVRRVGTAQRVCVVDNFKAWEDLPKIGYNYMIYLGTCINHPVDLGHELMFQGLKSAVEGGE